LPDLDVWEAVSALVELSRRMQNWLSRSFEQSAAQVLAGAALAPRSPTSCALTISCAWAIGGNLRRLLTPPLSSDHLRLNLCSCGPASIVYSADVWVGHTMQAVAPPEQRQQRQRAPAGPAAAAAVEMSVAPSPAALLLSNDSGIFSEGFYSPSLSTYGSTQLMPWKSVR
jgi:hypothetical protein